MPAEPGGPWCPSTPPEPGALLLGVVGPDGRVAHITPAPVLDEQLAARLAGDRPGVRFRFAAPCAEGDCVHWRGEDGCAVATAVARASDGSRQPLPRCAIRPRCRWFRQEGAGACSVCALVLTGTAAADA